MVLSRIGNAVGQAFRTRPSLPLLTEAFEDPQRLYDVLRAYYSQLDLYESVQAALYERDVWRPGMRGLRSPAYRVVEFHVPHLWPEGEDIETEDDAVSEAIEQVWKWSNWGAKKRVAARHFAMLGDIFVKVAQRGEGEDGRVFFQVLDPSYVTDFETDERGYLTWILIEVPRTHDDEKRTPYWFAEEWSKERQELRTWEMRQRGDQAKTNTKVTAMSTLGIDFIPIVYGQFRDVGNHRGAGAFTHAIDKIDEANLQATRLHQMLFRHNNVTWALQANAMDPAGRPLPPPQVSTDGGRTPQSDGTVEIGGEAFFRLPGNATIVPLVPNINYGDALAVLNAQIDELERDLPELAYYRLRDMGEISGVAVRLKLSDALDKASEARENAEALLKRADEMALTIGKNAGLFPEVTGEFADGAFEHDFALREIIPLGPIEEADKDLKVAQAAVAAQESGVSVRQTLRDRGYTDDEITVIETERESEQGALGDQLLRNFNAGAGEETPGI